MRPDGVESLRAIQGAVSGVLAPEITDPFAQEATQGIALIIGSLAAEWDTAAHDLVSDNAELRAILANGRNALESVKERNDLAVALVNECDGVMRPAGDGSLAISSLAAENNRLRAALVVLLEFAEDVAGEQGCEAIDGVRAEAYKHLRRVAVRGWSWFDVAGFRERMVQAKAEAAS